MLWLGFREFSRRLVSDLFVALQLAVTLILTCAVISSVLSRTRYYTPFQEILSSQGVVLRVTDTGEDISNLDGVAGSYGVYSWGGLFSKDGGEVFEGSNYSYALDDEYIKAISPELSEGEWLDKDSDTLECVITDFGGLAVGNTVKAGFTYYLPEDTDFTEPQRKVLEFKVVGILADGTKIPDISRGYEKEAFDFRNLYHDYSYEADGYPVMFTSLSQLKGEGVHPVPAFTQLVVFDEGLSDSEQNTLTDKLSEYGFVIDTLEAVNEHSLKYVNSQMAKLMPLLICILLLVTVSSVSISALSTKSSLKVYGIYYLCGSRWKSCIALGLISSIITQACAVLITITGVNLVKLLGLFENTVIEFGKAQVIACVGVLLFNLAVSAVMPIMLIMRNTPREILSANE